MRGRCQHCRLGCRSGWTPLCRCATSVSCHQVRWGTLSVLAHSSLRPLSALQAGLPLGLDPFLLLLCLLRNVSILPTDPAASVLLGRDDGIDVLHSLLQLPITIYNNCTAELSDCQQVLIWIHSSVRSMPAQSLVPAYAWHDWIQEGCQ